MGENDKSGDSGDEKTRLWGLNIHMSIIQKGWGNIAMRFEAFYARTGDDEQAIFKLCSLLFTDCAIHGAGGF